MGGMAAAWAAGAVWIRNICPGSSEQPKDTLCKHGETGGGPAALLARPDPARRQRCAIASHFLGSQWSPVLAPQVTSAPGLRHMGAGLQPTTSSGPTGTAQPLDSNPAQAACLGPLMQTGAGWASSSLPTSGQLLL